MFNFLFLLPHVFTIGQDIAACLDGSLSEEDYTKLIEDFSNLVLAIPELAGFVAIIQSILKVALVAFPVIDAVLTTSDDPSKPKAMRLSAIKSKVEASGLTQDDIVVATRSMKLLSDVSWKLAEAEQVAPDSNNTADDFDTSSFFDEHHS